MKHAVDMINQIRKTSSRNTKQSLLEAYMVEEDFKALMRFVYDPYIKTGIATKKLRKGRHSETGEHISVFALIEYFTKNQTGSDASVHFAWRFINQQTSTDAAELAMEIVTKNLKIGITDTTLNKVYGDDFIPRIGCMLGTSYEDAKKSAKPPYIATEKLDGARRILVKEHGESRLYSRSGIEDEGLFEIIEDAEYLPNNTVYDGELLARGDFDNYLELRQATNSIANSKGNRDGVTFNVFDIIPLEEFKRGESAYSALGRKILLGSIFKDDSIRLLHPSYDSNINRYGVDYDFKAIKSVPILGIVRTEEEIQALAETIWQRGGEGLMLNTTTGNYVLKRTKDLLKVKHVESSDLRVVDIQEGTNKNEGKLGAVIVEYKGQRVGVGSGFTDKEREALWSNHNLIVGKIIEIEHFGESKDKQGNISLNCPIYKGIRYDKEAE